MSSNDPFIFKNSQGEFVLEGDSINVIYNFNGENAPITVGVYNKMSKPIYVDWRKSGLVIDGNVVTYREPIDLYVIDEDMRGDDYARYLNDPEGLSTVKSEVRLNTQVLELTNFNFDKISDDKFQQNDYIEDGKSYKSKFRNILYTENDSPIYIESFLAIYEQANDLSNPLMFETSFYMSELEKAGKKSPSSLSQNRGSRGDLFYVKDGIQKEQKDNKGSMWGKIGKTSLDVLGVAAVVTGNIVVWALDGRGE